MQEFIIQWLSEILFVISLVFLFSSGDDFDKKTTTLVSYYLGIVLLVSSFVIDLFYLLSDEFEPTNFQVILGIAIGIIRCILFWGIARHLDEKRRGSGFIWVVFILNLILIFL
jgi:glucose uptake protein GlcU